MRAMRSLSSSSQVRVSNSLAVETLLTCGSYSCCRSAGVHVKGRGVRTVENALPLLLVRSSSGPGTITPRAVHRLDARVGGLLLVAKTREAETSLAAQFEAHQMLKQYRAILVGKVEPKSLADAVPSSHWCSRPPSDTRVSFVSAPIGGKLSCTAMQVVSYSRR